MRLAAFASWSVVVAVLAALLGATDADAAKKKKKKARATPLAVVVLPFEGRGSGGTDVKEAIELELELVDNVQVSSSDPIEGDIKKAGKRAYDASALGAVLSKRNVDVLIKGARGAGARSADALLVVAYGKDGQPRFYKELALGSEPDIAAATIIDAMKRDLENWKGAKVVRLPGAGDDDDAPLDVLVDDDDGGGGGRTVAVRSEKKKDAPRIDDDDDILTDGPGRVAIAEPPPKAAKVEKKGSPLDFNDEPVEKKPARSLDGDGDPADRDDDDARPKKKKKRLSIDDDTPPDEVKIARSVVDDDGRRRTLDIDDEVPAGPRDTKLGHTFALSGAFDGATWFYTLDGNVGGDQLVQAAFYPGGSALIDAWPLSFAGISWVGVDGELAVAAVPFRINGGQIAVTPGEFVSLQTRAGVAAKLRYTLKNGIGLGVRGGYRYFGATVETQTIDNAGVQETLTVVPGFDLHAAAVGAEVYLPVLIFNRRLEIELRADGLPATYYEELPDNPGGKSLAFGWAASLAMRYDIASGFFLEARGHSVGLSATFEEAGQRKAFVGNTLQELQGGRVLNLTAGFSTGLGFMF